GGVAGGIVGVADGNSSISNSYSTAAVKGTYAGGLVGYSVAGGSISQSYASGSVTAVGQGPYAELIRIRFEKARRRHGLHNGRIALRTDLFVPPSDQGRLF
ncbi:MAG: hypothetical protein J0G94_08260, partial [Sphingomonadales bacterium]|nr:hypothetical protein [Sphingomonadales bacterium]